MSCSIKYKEKIHKWIISKKAMDKLYPLLWDKIENAGQFFIDIKNKKTTNDITVVTGQKDSVSAPMSLINYHVHNLLNYLNGKTVTGSNSAEDMRECILFGLSGSIIHAIIAVEGSYVIQVNPCILENLVHLDKIITEDLLPTSLKGVIKDRDPMDFYRGLIILCTEIYFRASHAFRLYTFHKKFKVSTDDYIKYANNFKITNMFNDEVECSLDKKCDSVFKSDNVWVYERTLKKMTFEKYVDEYESDTPVFFCDKKGNTDFSGSITMADILKHGLLEPIKKLELGSSCKYSKRLWSERFFLINLYHNHVRQEGSTKYEKYDNLSTDEKMAFLKYAYKSQDTTLIKLYDNPVFYFFEMAGSCDFKQVQENIGHPQERVSKRSKKSQKSRIVDRQIVDRQFGYAQIKDTTQRHTSDIYDLYGSEKNCIYCKNAVPKLKKLGLNMNIHDYDSIKDAIKEAQKIDKNVMGIPALFKNGVKVDHNAMIE